MGYLQSTAEELNLGQLRTNPVSDRAWTRDTRLQVQRPPQHVLLKKSLCMLDDLIKTFSLDSAKF